MRGNFLSAAGALIFVLLPTTPATALEWEDFDQLSGETQVAFLRGAGEGISVMNAMLEFSGEPLIFCSPGDLDLTVEDYVHLSAESRRDVPVEVALMVKLTDEYPCP